VNGGFETGNLTGWTENGALAISSVPNLGAFSAVFFSNSSEPATLSQTLSGFTVGNEYQLSFFLNTQGQIPNGLTASVGGVEFLTLTNITTTGFPNYTANFTASSTSETLTFSGFNDQDASFLDDISVTAVGATPRDSCTL
jgi:hypothetical protein